MQHEWPDQSRTGVLSARRLRDNLDGVDNGVVDHRDEGEFDLALRSRLYIVKRLGDGVGSALGQDVEVLQNHVPVAGDIEYSAAGSSVPPIVLAKPWVGEKQRDT